MTDGPSRKPRRYRLVAGRFEAQSARVRRFRLMQMDPLPRLQTADRPSRGGR
jgi:hypothetical protein